MKKLMTMILLIAVMVTNIAVPERKASAKDYQAGVPYSYDHTDDDNYYYYEKDYYGTVVYQRDNNGNVFFDNRIFEAEIQNKSENLDDTKIVVGSSDQLICDIKYNLADGLTYAKIISPIATWSSSDTSIATIDKTTGVITGKKPGKVTITAQLGINNQKITRKIDILKNQTNVVTKGAKTKCQLKEFVSYDSKGNLVWTMTIKNCSKKRYMYVMASQYYNVSGLNWLESYNFEWGYNKKYKIKGYTGDLSFDLKPGKSKTIKLTMKKSQLKEEHRNLNLQMDEGAFVFTKIEAYKWNDVKKARNTGKTAKGTFIEL